MSVLDGSRLRRALTAAVAAAGVATAIAIPLASTPAQAAPAAPAGLSGTDWSEVTLPTGNYVGDGQNGNAISPVSCVAGSQFCLAVTSNPSVSGPNGVIGQSDVVTTDGGRKWTAYTDLPSSSIWVTSASCASTFVCWVAGSGPLNQPEVAETTDGGQTWTLQTPADWAVAAESWWPNAIDCVTATTCWLAGVTAQSPQTPVVAETTDGTHWATFTNLPTIVQYDSSGTYQLNAISCTSALDCVAAGGLNEGNGLAQVISTTDGGATWTLSTDPALSGIQQIFSLSCLPGPLGLPACTAAADALEAAGPVVISSDDGGATWSGAETYDDTGWLSSISCADLSHCWGAGAGTSVALLGTTNAGGSWDSVTSDTTNEYGTVSCATGSFCVATTDNELWKTTDDGGLTTTLATTAQHFAVTTAKKPVTRGLPRVSGLAVSARIGRSATVTGQYRGSATKATVTITPPTGKAAAKTVSIGLNGFYSATINDVARGVTRVTVKVGSKVHQRVDVHGYPAAAPTVTSLSSHAGPVRAGTTLTVRGTNFRGVTAVDFGSKRGTAVRVLSAKELSVKAPAGSGDVYVAVVTKNGGPSALTGRSVFNFLPKPAIRALSKSGGPARGGRLVLITGTGFAFVRTVYFGSHQARRVQVISAREILVRTPAGSGRVQVRVVTAGGKSATVKAAYYRY